MDKQKQMAFSDVSTLTMDGWRERMARFVVSKELQEGQLIPAKNEEGQVDYYKVYKKVTTGDGLIAYALKPAINDSTLKPQLIFRPTQRHLCGEDAFEAIENDSQPNIGEIGWRAAEEPLAALMNDPEFLRVNERLDVVGYSLGGVHAQFFLAAHHEKVSKAFYYGSPSVQADVAERFATDISERDEPLEIHIYRMQGDPVTCIGGKHIGWGVPHNRALVTLHEFTHQRVRFFNAHILRLYDTNDRDLQSVTRTNAEDLNERLDISRQPPEQIVHEERRQRWAEFTYNVFRGISQFLKFITRWTGWQTVRRSIDLAAVSGAGSTSGTLSGEEPSSPVPQG